MCKIGDIVGIPHYKTEENEDMGYHYFVVISDELGKIGGIEFDMVGSVMSSFKSESQRRYKCSLKENLEITEAEFDLPGGHKRDGYIKANQLHYFSKKKTNHYVVGQVDGDVLLKLLKLVVELNDDGVLVKNTFNIC